MALKGLYKTDVVTCSRDALLTEAARLMRDYKVGDIVVVEGANGSRRPVGVITDRDIVLGAVCDRADDIASMKVEDLMSPDIVTIGDDASLFDAIELMRENGVSRVPVVDGEGKLCGILSASRAFRVMTEEMMELSSLSDNRKEFPQQVMSPRFDGMTQGPH